MFILVLKFLIVRELWLNITNRLLKWKNKQLIPTLKNNSKHFDFLWSMDNKLKRKKMLPTICCEQNTVFQWLTKTLNNSSIPAINVIKVSAFNTILYTTSTVLHILCKLIQARMYQTDTIGDEAKILYDSLKCRNIAAYPFY